MVVVPFPVPVDDDSHFPLENIPFGIFSSDEDPRRRGATALGDYVVDLALLEAAGVLTVASDFPDGVFSQPTLNRFAALPRPVRRGAREAIVELLSRDQSPVFRDADLKRRVFHHQHGVKMHLPMTTTEFTDYSSAEEHVANCFAMTGMAFQPDNSFFFSPIRRPCGVFRRSPADPPAYQPTQKLDYELEMAVVVSHPLPYGHTTPPDRAAEDHVFGFVLMNDWSARDVQMYESVPVGPVNSKAFATTLAPWVVTPEALAPAATRPYRQRDGQVPRHLRHRRLDGTTYDIDCAAHVCRHSRASGERQVSRSNVKHMFYSPAQLIAHRASTGCGLVTGELVGMGTVSSPAAAWPDQTLSPAGCLFEMTWDGTREVAGGGTWLEDGDTVRLEAWVQGQGGRRIGFGSVVGTVTSARPVDDDGRT